MKTQTYTTTKQAIITSQLPEQTRTYKPFSNERLINLTLEGITQAGFSLGGENYTSTKEGNVSNGRYLIRSVEDTEMQLLITWNNSYNKKLSLAFGIGAWMKICGNGMMGWKTVGSFKKKHMGEIQEFTPLMISEYIRGAGDMFLNLQKEREQMKQIELTRRITAELLGRAYIEEKFITSTQLNIIKGELEHPTYLYGDPNSLWSLYNYTTFALKEDHPEDWMQDHIDAHSFFTSISGIIIPQKEEIQIPEVIDSRQLSWLDQIPAEV